MSEDELTELSAEEILTFGPCVEAQVWTPMWLQEARAPIAVAAGRPKLGPIFNSDGVGKAVVIRPCISRGKRIRGLSPIYTPQMLEANSSVYDGWPMFMDHVPPELAEKMAKYGRSVKELGGQILKGHWSRDFVHESDAEYGYQKGATLAEIWATPFIRRTVGENANLLHTSINAWPKSGKPGPVPWRPGTKGMVIEGIRRVPAGSVDFVVRGGAGGRLLVQEGLEEEGAWPETGDWTQEDVALVVSVADALYASAQMPRTLPTKPEELAAYLAEEAPHLLPALAEAETPEQQVAKLMKGGMSMTEAWAKVKGSSAPAKESDTALTEADVRRLVESMNEGQPTVEEFEKRLSERAEEMLTERDEQRHLASVAATLIEDAKGIPASWKTDLKARYAMLPSGPSQALLVEAEMDGEKVVKSVEAVLKEAVAADLEHSRGLIADAKGKPRVTGEGAKKPDTAGGESERAPGKSQEGEVPYWRERFASMGLAESADKAVEVYGGKVEG
jgi:hypothetical protein